MPLSNHKRVFIVGNFDAWIGALFRANDWSGTRDMSEADVVVFTGGEDINPALYHEEPIEGIRFNDKRDYIEKQAFDNARALGVPMVGICRGAQLLNVLCGGRLWQHVDNHTTGHYITDVITKEVTLVTSTHHQQMRPHPQALLVAKAGGKGRLSSSPSLCTTKMAEGVTLNPLAESEHDPEVVWYPDSMALCFQPHPEIPSAFSTRAYFWNVFDRYITPVINEGMAA